MDRGRGAALFVAFVFVSTAIAAQNTNTPAATTTAPPAPSAEAGSQSSQAFIQAADEVMAEMSKLLDLPILDPLKKSLRSKEQIRAYLVQEEKDDRTDAERYADDKALEAFGLVPKGFPLDSFMLNVMTDQVAGLYDPKAKEFYIASWISVEDQK